MSSLTSIQSIDTEIALLKSELERVDRELANIDKEKEPDRFDILQKKRRELLR